MHESKYIKFVRMKYREPAHCVRTLLRLL